jgi:hypothetical protein
MLKSRISAIVLQAGNARLAVGSVSGVRMQEREELSDTSVRPQLSRRLLIFCTAGAGVCLLIGFSAATYAIARTPGIQSIPVYDDTGVLRYQSKFLYLCWPVFVQAVLFGTSVYHSIKWQILRDDIVARIARSNEQLIPARRVDVARLYKILCYAIVGFELAILIIVLNNAHRLLNL